MTKRQVVNATCLFFILCLGSAASMADQPNIFLFLTDDFGYSDCKTFNPQPKIKPLQVDLLAKENLHYAGGRALDESSAKHHLGGHSQTPNLITGNKQEPAQPLSEIFDGKSLDNWILENGKPVPSGWEVNDGTIHRKRGKKRIGNIITREQYGDFDLSFEWKIAKGGNSGIKYRVRKYGRKMLGIEYQIFDSGKTSQPPSKKDTGSIYALFEPSPNRKVNPAGQFNSSRIVARGNRIDHWLNGQLIASATIGNAEWEKRVAESKFNDVPDFGRNSKGRIMLTDHGAEVWYRNLKISLPPEPSGSNAVMPK